LREALVVAVQVGSDTTHLEELVFLSALGECDLIEVIILGYTSSELVVVYIFAEDLINCFVNRSYVVHLH